MPSPPESGAALPLWVALFASYLLGSIPFGLVAARWVRGLDLRQIGSGNIGATNAMRVLGKGWGYTVFALDLLKGIVPALLLGPLAASGEGRILAQVLCGTLAVFGHCFPVWLGFRGGKGAATACGVVVAIDPIVFLVGGAVWLLSLKLFRYVGLSSVLMGLTFPIVAYIRHPGGWALTIGTMGVALLIIVRHRANIGRILRGDEPHSGDPIEPGNPGPRSSHG